MKERDERVVDGSCSGAHSCDCGEKETSVQTQEGERGERT